MSLLDKNYSKKVNDFGTFIKTAKFELAISFVVFGTFLILALIFSGSIILFFQNLVPFSISFSQTSPQEMFINSFKIAGFASLILSTPVFIYQLLKLKILEANKKQKIDLKKSLFISYTMTIIGIILACFVFIPLQLFFLLGLNLGIAEIDLGISEFIAFCLGSILTTCLILQLPVVYLLIKKNKFFTYKQIFSMRKKVLIFALSAAFLILSPPELLSLVMLSIIIIVFYFLILVLSKTYDLKA